VAVTDEELLAAQATVAQAEGAFVCPEGAACFAAVRQLRDRGWLTGHEQVVVLNTGTGNGRLLTAHRSSRLRLFTLVGGLLK
jgi:threonine synthase